MRIVPEAGCLPTSLNRLSRRTHPACRSLRCISRPPTRQPTGCSHSSRRLLFWSMSTFPLSEVKARLSEIADEVDRTHDRVHVTRNGREYVVLLSAEDLESLEATIELLRDDAGMERIRAADAAVAAGDVTIASDMSALMDERRQREHRDG